MNERIDVRVRDCACPGTPHPDGDVVYLLPSLSLEGGAAAEMERDLVIDGYNDVTEAERIRLTLRMLARLTDVYVRYGAVAWNFERLNEQGRNEPEPFDVEVLLRSYSLSQRVAAKASELYSEDVIGPLLKAAAAAGQPPNRQQRRSRTGRTGSSTSPKAASIPKRSGSSSPDPSDGPALRIAR